MFDTLIVLSITLRTIRDSLHERILGMYSPIVSCFVLLHRFQMFLTFPPVLWQSPCMFRHPRMALIWTKVSWIAFTDLSGTWAICMSTNTLKYWYSRSDKMPGQKRPTNCATRQWVMISRIFSGAIFYSILLATFFRSFDSARVLIKLMHAI